MKTLPHHYRASLADGPGAYALARIDGAPAITSAPPVEFDGPGDAWSPEHLLLASVETCLLFTVRALARASKLELVSVTMSTEGTLDRQDGVTRFTEIVVRLRLVLAAGSDPDRARRLVDKAEKTCLVTASLATPVRVEPDITFH